VCNILCQVAMTYSANSQFDSLMSKLHSQKKKCMVFTSDDDRAIELNKVR